MRCRKVRKAMSNVSRETSGGNGGSGRLGGYEHIATRWGREEVKMIG